MSKVGNTINITAIGDSETVHGALCTTVSLTQAFNKQTSQCVPNWAGWADADKPIVYLYLQYGSREIQPLSHTWYYNGVELSFNENTGACTTQNYTTTFKEVTYTINGYNAVALKIIGNLAGAGNLDLDRISIRGQVEMAGAPVGFAAEQVVRISTVNSNGYVGVINFANGKSILLGEADTISATAALYVGSGTPAFTVQWKLNGADVAASKLSNGGKTVSLTGADVTDIAVLTAIFFDSENHQVAVASETVDDVQDEEYMYIKTTIGQYSSNNGTITISGGTDSTGKDVFLRPGQAVRYQFYMAKADNPSTKLAKYTDYGFAPKGSDGNALSNATTSISCLSGKTAGADGAYSVKKGSAGEYYGEIIVPYDEVNTLGGHVSGDLYAYIS